MSIDDDCPMETIDRPPTMEEVVERWRSYQLLREGADMRSWAADQLHDDVAFLLAKLGVKP